MGKLILCLQHPTSNNIPGRAKYIQICPGHCGGGRRYSFCFASERIMPVEFNCIFPPVSAKANAELFGLLRGALLRKQCGMVMGI